MCLPLLTPLTPVQKRLFKMLAAFIGESQLQNMRNLMAQDSGSRSRDQSEQLVLLSPRIFDHFSNGRLSLKHFNSTATSDSVRSHSLPVLPF